MASEISNTHVPMAAPPEPKVYRVLELTRLIKHLLEDEIGEVWVEGEISNLRQPGSGHLYFTLKDESAQVAAVMFRGDQRQLRFQPADGQMVRLFGQLSVYEKSGQYQIIVRRITAAGQGALQAAFEALKKKLEAEGLFKQERKRPLPFLPRQIGIVTSPTGAALRDMLVIFKRRFPNLRIVLAPARVQGAGAAEEIARALDDLNVLGGLDLIIVGRGGGSLEDLWCFNEEIVARAVARSVVPVISAVGHEIDFTICDFVADLRAPTPSAAAELAVPEKTELLDALCQQHQHLRQALRRQLADYKHRLRAAAGSYVFREPGFAVRRHREVLRNHALQMRHRLTLLLRQRQQHNDELVLRLRQSLHHQFADWRHRLLAAAGSHAFREPGLVVRRHREMLRNHMLQMRHSLTMLQRQRQQDKEELALRLRMLARQHHGEVQQQIQRLLLTLKGLNPLLILERGYSITTRPNGTVLKDAGQARTGEQVHIRLARGALGARVSEKYEESERME